MNQFNLTLLKNTRITESKTFQFCAEAINAMKTRSVNRNEKSRDI